MKTKNTLLLLILSNLVLSCGEKKNNNSNFDKTPEQKEKPNEIIDVPDNTDELGSNINQIKKMGNDKLDDYNSNLFDKYCSTDGNMYTDCDFSKIKLQPYSNKQKEEFNFKVNYSFDKCKFDKFNLEFFTNSGKSIIKLGNHTIDLTGYLLNIRDSYFWDTNTNKYDKSCSFVIRNIETNFSKFTKDKINSFLSKISENKVFVKELNSINPLIDKLKDNVKNLNADNFKIEFNKVLENISKEKLKYAEEDIMYSIIADIEEQLLLVKESNPSLIDGKDSQDLKNKISQLSERFSNILNTTRIQDSINVLENKVKNMISTAENIPNFNKNELKNIKETLERI